MSEAGGSRLNLMANASELHYKGYSFDVHPYYEDDDAEWWGADVFQEVEGSPLYHPGDPKDVPRPEDGHTTKGSAVRAAKERVNLALARGSNPRACALPGALSTKARDRLPDKAFGLPKERKYPMYRMSAGEMIPSGSHASNAKARAQAQFDDGKLSAANLKQIDRKADKVLAACGTKGKKRKKNPQGEDLDAYMDNEVGRVGYSTPGERGGMEIVYRHGTTLAEALKGIPSGSNIYAVSFDYRKPWRGAWMWRTRKKNPDLEVYSVSELEDKDTLTSGHMHNLKVEGQIDGVPTRWWLSRMTREDGETHAVYVEQLTDGKWQDVYQYGEAVGYEERFGNPEESPTRRTANPGTGTESASGLVGRLKF